MSDSERKARNCERVKTWNRKNPERARAIQFKTTHGVALGDLPPYPADGLCELCGNPSRHSRTDRGHTGRARKLDWDHDHDLERFGFTKAQCHRGWICYRCNNMLGHVESVGIDKVFKYLMRKRV